MLWNRKILLLILSAGVVEPRPRELHGELHPPGHEHVPVPFNFGYEVSSADTGDTKSHQETLEDGVLRGSYSVVQPDGFRRVVNYVSDAEHGFRADVTFEKGYGDVIPTVVQQQASAISVESTGSTSQSQVSSSESLSTKADSSSSANLDISNSLSSGNTASSQGFVSINTSPLVQVSDINNYGNAQFEASFDSSQSTSGVSSQSTSGISSAQDVSVTNNVVESSSGAGLSLDTTNLNSANEVSTDTFGPPRHQSLEHYYTNSQIFCASCNTGTFGTGSFGPNFDSANSGASSAASTSSGSSSSVSSSLGSSSFESSSSGSTSLVSNNVISDNSNAEISFASNAENTVVGSSGVTDFGDIFSRSFLVASENLDNINTVELAKAGFDTDQLFAYKLVRVPIVEEVTRE